MNALERYLDVVCGSLSGSSDLRQHLRAELREHLESAVAAHRAAGLGEPEAIARAIQEFGDSQAIRSEFQGLYGRRVVSLFVERAMDWKERNMKNDWKWSFTAQVALLLTLVLLGAWMCSVMVFITPFVVEEYHIRDLTAPAYLRQTISVSHFIKASLLLWLAVAAAGVVLFEIRCRKDYKGMIRLAATAVLALIFTVAAAVETSAVGIAMVQVRGDRAQATSAPAQPAPDSAPQDSHP